MKIEYTPTAEDMLANIELPSDPAVDLAHRLSAGTLVDRERVEAELDDMLATIASIWSMEPDQAMRVCSVVSARLTEMYIHLHRVEARDRRWKQVRTQQVDKLLAEVDRQFKFHSRIVEIRRQDAELIR